MAPKRLLVFCDGTGADGELAQSGATAEATAHAINVILENSELEDSAAGEATRPQVIGGLGGGTERSATNVMRLARSVATSAEKQQLVFYQSGVGSESHFKGDPVTGTTALQALGTAVACRIRDAYGFIAQNFEEGDEICIFGFSRGAYIAMKLSELIDRIGLLQRQDLGLFFKVWSQLVDGEALTIPLGPRRPRIKCVGLWDTVGSIYGEVDALQIKDTSLPPTIDVALHALSLHENRKKFLPTLWTVPSTGVGKNQILKQVWFPGSHSDVGGDSGRRELADIALFWMAGEVEDFVELDTALLRSSAEDHPDIWGTSQPHNAYMETPIPERYIVGTENRLQSQHIVAGAVFHESVKCSPQSLASAYNTVTLRNIEQSLGSEFQPEYPQLNRFEAYCKRRWGEEVIEAPTSPPVFEDPGDVIRSPVRWVAGTSSLLPPKAIVGGQELNGEILYIVRAPYKGGLHPGKASRDRAYICYDGKETWTQSNFERLVGNAAAVRWVQVEDRYSHDKLDGAIPVHGGYQADGRVLYIAQASLHGGVHCGKVSHDGHAHIPYDGKEEIVANYSVLVFA